MGVTPKQTSNLLYSRRNTATVRSPPYRRAEDWFAINATCGSLEADPDERRPIRGRLFAEEPVIRRIYLYFLCLTVLVPVIVPAAYSQDKASEKPPAVAPAAGFRAELVEQRAYYEKRQTRLAETMAAENYAWHPGGRRPFRRRSLYHIVGANITLKE
jgi:hypothetical protein